MLVDENGVTTAMARCYTRAAAGERAVRLVSAGHWRQLTILGGLSLGGLVASMSVEAATSCTRLPPARLPDLNPIEHAWSKLKALLRTAAVRTKGALDDALAAVIDRLTAAAGRRWSATASAPPSN